MGKRQKFGGYYLYACGIIGAIITILGKYPLIWALLSSFALVIGIYFLVYLGEDD